MLKKRYKLFLVIFLVLLFGSLYLTTQMYAYYTDSPPVENKDFTYETVDEMNALLSPIRFSFKNGDATLSVLSDFEEGLDDLQYFLADDSVSTISADEFSYTEDCTGTLMITGTSDSIDIDGDGEADSVAVSAKSQTLNSLTYSEYAYNSNCFEDASIPVELYYVGTYTMATKLYVIVYGEYYTGTVYVRSNAGTSEEIEVGEDNIIWGLSTRDLREGLSVTIYDEENDQYLIGMYITEDYPVFSAGYLATFSNLFLLILLIAVGTLGVCVIRQGYRNRKEKREALV